MSYESIIISKNPELYIPFRSFSGNNPDDIVQFRNCSIVGSLEKIKTSKFPRTFIKLIDSSLVLDQESPPFFPPATYIIWFYKFEQSGPVIFIGNQEDGIGFSVDENLNLVAFFNGTETTTFSISPDDSFHMLSVVVDYDVFSGEEVSYKALFYFDENLILEEPLDYVPDIENIYINSFYSEEASSGLFAHFSTFNTALDPFDIETIYSIATIGRQRLSVSEETDIPFIDTQQNAVQTSWQAYGVVTGKV